MKHKNYFPDCFPILHDCIEFEFDKKAQAFNKQNYPPWYLRVIAVHDFKGNFDNKKCIHYKPNQFRRGNNSSCLEYHSEVATILITVAGWSCHEAEKYNKSVIDLCLQNPGSMTRFKTPLWPYKRCSLYRQSTEGKPETDQDYFYRLCAVIRSKEYSDIFNANRSGQMLPKAVLLNTKISDIDIPQTAKLSWFAGSKRAKCES